jgi:hypothetical protein
MTRRAVLAFLVLLACSCGPAVSNPAGEIDVYEPAATPPTSHATAAEQGLPQVCEEVTPLYDGALGLPDDSEVVAQFPFADGVVVLARQDLPSATYFAAVECFSGGGAGFSGGGPGEVWQGPYRVDYSDSGYAIVIVEDPAWTVLVEGQPVEVIPADGVGAGLVEGFFDRPPSVAIGAESEPAVTGQG